MYAQHHRWAIWNQWQHPYKHNLAEFSFINPAIPGATNVEAAMNYILAVLYPNTEAAVANVAALPLVGNTLNDYRVVLDDGDGKQAAYRWEQREGEATPSWHKVMDMDWSSDSILAHLVDVTLPLYVSKNGRTDLDVSGSAITGVYAGQSIYGGNAANQNLTLRANSGDGVGPATGYVQVDDNFRPTQNNAFSLGTLTERFISGYFSTSVLVDTLTLASGLITDSSGNISFDDEALVTTGNITGDILTGTSLVASSGGNTLSISPTVISNSTGLISFADENLITTGIITAASGSQLGDITFTNGQIVSATGTISFDNENLITTGTINAGNSTFTRVDVDDLRLDSNSIVTTTLNQNLILSANGTGVVDIQSAMLTLGQTVTGTLSVTGQLNIDNIRVDGNIISSQDLNGNITVAPNGTGNFVTSSIFRPSADGTLDLGTSGNRFKDLFLSGNISNGTDTFIVSELLDLRSTNYRDFARTSPAQAGDSLFYDSVNGVWLASAPDTEIDHGTVSGLLDDDHTQYALLVGRSGGQTLIGGTLATNDLILDSTSHATKGFVKISSDLAPTVGASYSGSWSGTDLGDATLYFRDIYVRGEMRGARLENFTVGTLPSSSGQNVGRVVYATDVSKAYVDTGSQFKVLGVSKFIQDVSFNGIETVKDINVSSDITDARTAIWALHDNSDDFEKIYTSIKTTSASNVRITTNVPLAAGSYRLIGIE
jgi:hypothetical protein